MMSGSAEPHDSQDAGDPSLHALPGCRVSRVHGNVRRSPARRSHALLDPEDHVVSRTSCIVSKIVVQTDVGNFACTKQRNHLVRPLGERPAWRGGAFIVKKDLHVASALHINEASRPQVPHTDQTGVAITVAEDHIHHAARFISGCRIKVANHQNLVPGRALATGDQETRGRDLAHLPACGNHSGWNSGSVAAEVAGKHHCRLSRAMIAMRSTPANSMQGGLVMLASRWHRSRDCQRSEGAGSPDRHGHGEQDRGGRAAGKANGSDRSPRYRSHSSLRFHLCCQTPLLGFSFLRLPQFASPLVCDAVPATKVDASGTKSHGDRVSEGSPHEVVRCLDHSLTEFTSMGALPFDVLHAAHNTRRAA